MAAGTAEHAAILRDSPPKGGALQDEVGEGLAHMGAEPKFGTPESFGAMIAAEIPKWAEAVHAAGVRLD